MNDNGVEMSVENRKLCTGCGLCAMVCPTGALSMICDSDGFVNPSIDRSKCTNCGICLRICKLKDGLVDLGKPLPYGLYAGRAKSCTIRSAGASGGVALAFLLSQFCKGKNVVGAVFRRDFRSVRHVICSSVDDVMDTATSKYVQSDFMEPLRYLQSNPRAPMVVVGTPCQIHAARKLANLCSAQDVLLIDFFCHGVPSQHLWHALIRELESAVGTLEDLNLRFKVDSWHSFYLRACGSRGIKMRRFHDTPFGWLYIQNYGLRSSCLNCALRTYTAADIRVGDYWGRHFADDRLGMSIVIPVTDAGYKALELCKEISLRSTPTEWLLQSQPIGIQSSLRQPHDWKSFDQDLRNGKSLAWLYRKYGRRQHAKHKVTSKGLAVIRRLVPRRLGMFIRNIRGK